MIRRTVNTLLASGDKWLESQLVRVMPQGWIDLTTRL
jgi:hypothetical protein